MFQCVQELIWTRGVLAELGVGGVEYPVKIETDSKSVMDLVMNLGLSARTKHYTRKLSFVRDEWRLGNVKLQYTNSEDLAVDALTKSLAKTELARHLGVFRLRQRGHESVYVGKEPRSDYQV